ncbi:MAG: 4-(cytidine 5'-diphospho)-2-C-methyl-D-erythritol kinase [Gammaproteobacteria bacterium]|nr:4-(cytidine 5'-diphospho)-2-C-methyl-D-erythritol kinase [Gammaproteobacteria bacterium]
MSAVAVANSPPAGRWWPAPAKLNLFLQIVGRRPDGYHLLQTIFQIIDLCDELQFDLTADGAIRRIDDASARPPSGVAPDQDLCVRAARALQAASGTALGVDIRLRKRIPLGGGLGGGSSDAATTLLVLNTLWSCGLDIEQLVNIGLQLGADVPVFIRGQSAWADGVGERLTPLPLPQHWFLVVHPGVAVPTREVFQAPELTRNSPVITIPAPQGPAGRNDCEPVVRPRFPAVAEALDWLARFAPARLTGTGACVFAEFDSPAAAERIAARVPEGWRAWVVRGLQTSPLLPRLAAADEGRQG